MTRSLPRLGKTCRALTFVAAWSVLRLHASQNPAPDIAHNPPTQEIVEPVGLADWPALAKALKQEKATQGRIVSFRELWQATPAELAEPLALSGVVLRRFRREAVGQFPPLEELWLRTDDDNLVLITNKSKAERNESSDITAPGSAVDIVAKFIRKVRYDASDEPRVAPWLVACSVVAAGSAHGLQPVSTQLKSNGGSSELLLVLLAVITASALLRVVLFYAKRSRSG